MKKARGNPNHPQKGSAIKVQPIRRLEDIKAIKKLLAGNLRDLAIFTLGINSALRASDLLAIRHEQVNGLKVGDSFEIKEQKTGQYRHVMLNKVSHKSVMEWIQSQEDWQSDDWLFRSRKGGKLSVPSLTALVKTWCRAINLTENFGSHSLRKTFGYQQRVAYGLGTAQLISVFNHNSERQTLAYLGIEGEEIRSIHLNTI